MCLCRSRIWGDILLNWSKGEEELQVAVCSLQTLQGNRSCPNPLYSPGSVRILAVQNGESASHCPSQSSQYHVSIGSKNYIWISVCFSDKSSSCASELFCHWRCDTNVWAALVFTFLIVYNLLHVFPSPCVFNRALRSICSLLLEHTLKWWGTLHQRAISVLKPFPKR